MNIHKNACLTLRGRGLLVALVQGGLSRSAVAERLEHIARQQDHFVIRFPRVNML